MNLKKISFKNQSGNNLTGLLHNPKNPKSKTFAMLAHCFTCSKNLKAVKNISNVLAYNNIGVLRFDFTGLGESEGDFSDTTFTTNVSDILSAANFINNNFGNLELLIGHSLGGAAVLQAANEIASSKAIVTIGSPNEPKHILKLLKDDIDEINTDDEATVSVAGREFKIKKKFLEDLDSENMENHIGNLRKALLIMHSPLDNIVGIDNASKIFLTAKHPKSFVTLDTADHLLSDEVDSLYAGSVISSWAERYIHRYNEDTKGINKSDNQFRVLNSDDTYSTYMSVNNHNLIADEPESAGGNNLGPDPYDYLLASLGSCTAMTVRMYARRKKWQLEEVSIKLNHKKIHAKDCEDCESNEGKIDYIEEEIEFKGDLSDEQRKRLEEISKKCPVHKTLKSEVIIKSKFN